MGAMRFRSRRQLEEELQVSRAAVFRARTFCREQVGKGHDFVSAQAILELLDPMGRWEYAAVERKEGPAPEMPDPRADPLTGCLPVTADGS